MELQHRYVIASLMIIGVVASALVAWWQLTTGRATPVSVAVAELGQVEGQQTALGPSVIRSCHSEMVFGAVGARVAALPVPGARIRAGATLMTLTDEALDAALEQARLRLSAARQQVATTCAAGSPERRQPRRLESLRRERIVDAARADRSARARGARADEPCALARRSLAQAARIEREAALRREVLMVRAPIDGIVSEVNVASGSVVTDQWLLRLASEQCLMARVRFPRDAARWMARGAPACIRPAGVSAPVTCAGTVGDVIPSADDVIVVDVRLDALPDGVRLDAPVVVSLPLSSRGEVVRIDRSAVDAADGHERVWKIDRDSGRVHRLPVETGVIGNDYVEVRAGLTAGDEVVVGAHATLTEGSQVEVIRGRSRR